jgi:glycosyltransferase involved in cell wall biosynthesis
MRETFTAAGITVIIDELLFSGHPTVKNLCSQFDVVIANTIVCWPLVSLIMDKVDVKWYIHESFFLNDYINAHTIQYEQISPNVEIWTVTSVPAKILREKGWSCALVTPGITAVNVGQRRQRENDVVNVVVIGGYEPRKGQDLACAMLSHISPNLRDKLQIDFFGRTVDEDFYETVRSSAIDMPNVFFNSAVSRLEAQGVIKNADVVLVPSRDEALSLVVVEALQQGAIVVCSEAVGVAEFLENGKTAFIARSPAPYDLAVAMRDALSCRNVWPAIREHGAILARSEFSEHAFRGRLLTALADTIGQDTALT